MIATYRDLLCLEVDINVWTVEEEVRFRLPGVGGCDGGKDVRGLSYDGKSLRKSVENVGTGC